MESPIFAPLWAKDLSYCLFTFLYVQRGSLIPARLEGKSKPLHVAMQSRLSHHPRGMLCASGHLALLPFGIVVTPYLRYVDKRPCCCVCPIGNSYKESGSLTGSRYASTSDRAVRQN